MGLKADWGDAKKLLNDMAFLEKLQVSSVMTLIRLITSLVMTLIRVITSLVMALFRLITSLVMTLFRLTDHEPRDDSDSPHHEHNHLLP